MNVLFFLTPKEEVTYIFEEENVKTAIDKIEQGGYSSVPIIDQSGIYKGTLTEGDLLRTFRNRSAFLFKSLEKMKVRDLIRKKDNVPVNSKANMEDLLSAAMTQNFVPVTDDKNIFIGIVTRKDIIQTYIKKLQSEQ